jgi:hypothetical protein
MTGKGVCRIHGGAPPPWQWRTVTRWDGERGRVVEKRVRSVKSSEQRERERRAKLELKIAKYQAERELTVEPLCIHHMLSFLEERLGKGIKARF